MIAGRTFFPVRSVNENGTRTTSPLCKGDDLLAGLAILKRVNVLG